MGYLIVLYGVLFGGKSGRQSIPDIEDSANVGELVAPHN